MSSMERREANSGKGSKLKQEEDKREEKNQSKNEIIKSLKSKEKNEVAGTGQEANSQSEGRHDIVGRMEEENCFQHQWFWLRGKAERQKKSFKGNYYHSQVKISHLL